MHKISALCLLMAATAFAKDQELSLLTERYTLGNGMTVLLSQDRSSPLVATNVWTNVGSVNEEPGKTGQAHFFEHLMFEGSRQVKDPPGHFHILEKAGAFSINASTSFDRTNFYQTVPKSALELALSLESSRMFDLVITESKLKEQLEVVRRELDQRYSSQPYGLATLKAWESLFPKNHPMFGRVIGSHKDLQAATLDDFQSFYDTYYGPSNSVLTLVGDFEVDDAKALINKYFATLPKNDPIPKAVVPKIVLQEQEIIQFTEKLGKVPLIRIHYISPSLFAKGDAELDIWGHILTGGEFGRLTKAITRDKLLASSVSAYQQSMEHLSVFTIDTILNPGVDENVVIEEIDKVLADLVQAPVAQTEMDRAVNSILTTQIFSIQELGGSSGRAEMLQIYNRFKNDPDYLLQDMKRYQSVKEEDLKLAAKQYLPVGKARKVLIAKPIATTVAKQGN
jgi:zinc protease